MILAITSSHHTIDSLWVWATERWELSWSNVWLNLSTASNWWESSGSLLLRILLNLGLHVHLGLLLLLLGAAVLWHTVGLWDWWHTSYHWETSKTWHWRRLETELLGWCWAGLLKFMLTMSEWAFITIFTVSVLKVFADGSLVSGVWLLVLIAALEATSVTASATSSTEASTAALIVTAVRSWLIQLTWWRLLKIWVKCHVLL